MDSMSPMDSSQTQEDTVVGNAWQHRPLAAGCQTKSEEVWALVDPPVRGWSGQGDGRGLMVEPGTQLVICLAPSTVQRSGKSWGLSSDGVTKLGQLWAGKLGWLGRRYP